MIRFRCLQSGYTQTSHDFRRKYFLNFPRHLCNDANPSKSVPRKKYSNTVLLPSTTFPLRVEPEEKVLHDAKIAEATAFSSLYEWQSEALSGEEFVLHDGPPYANGNVHIGHAVNKILKDIVIRNKLLDGHKIHYIPGWDCHGLPIELKAITDKKGNQLKLNPLKTRNKAKDFAASSILAQMRAFKSWGLMADWQKCYFTYDTPYVENQLQQFYELYQKGFIYRNFLPIYWSTSSRTALAEAELEYNEQHKSTCVVFRLKVEQCSVATGLESPLYALIWTTTPWTLPANAAIGFNSKLEYSLVTIEELEGVFIVASALVTQLEQLIQRKIAVQSTVEGSALEGSTYRHPIKHQTILPFLPAEFVSSDKGTGLVHIAPCHGHDDFALGRKHNLPVDILVDEDGKYVSQAGPGLEGLEVLGLGGGAVRLLLEDDILHTHKLSHSYPYDWRTKKPVIICASKQWFMDLDSVKPAAASFVADIPVFPENLGGKENLLTKINSRSYWCISRQRVWGVPIPIFFSKDSDTPIISRKLVDHYCNLLKQHGPDFWWTLSNAELCPANLVSESGVKADEINQLHRSTDILDIWLDSGLSWSAVLDGRTADLYLEGVDQCTGWFQSSLLTATALKNRPPFKSIFVHGFVVDEKGLKMSKSLGNVVDPREVISGSKNKKQTPFGVDVLRWWVAGHTVQHANIRVGLPILIESQQEVQRIRAIFRHILGNLDGVEKIPTLSPNAAEISNCIIDRYMLHELFNFNHQINEFYKNFQYNLVRIAINNLVANQLSGIYFSTVKSRMYCSEVSNQKRYASQVIFYATLEVLLRATGPVLPFLTEEVCQHHPCLKETTYFRRRPLAPLSIPDTWNDPSVKSDMETVFSAKYAINKVKGTENSWNLHATLSCGGNDFKVLKKLNDEDSDQLLEIFQVRSLEIRQSEDGPLAAEVQVVDIPLCLRCRRNSISVDSDICQSCYDVLGCENSQQRHQAP